MTLLLRLLFFGGERDARANQCDNVTVVPLVETIEMQPRTRTRSVAAPVKDQLGVLMMVTESAGCRIDPGILPSAGRSIGGINRDRHHR